MTVREMLEQIPQDERASGWITVIDPTGRFFYGHRDDIPERVANRHGQVYYGWAKFVSEELGDLPVGTVSGDQNIAGVIDIYIKEER